MNRQQRRVAAKKQHVFAMQNTEGRGLSLEEETGRISDAIVDAVNRLDGFSAPCAMYACEAFIRMLCDPLGVDPKHVAARILLHECKESMGEATSALEHVKELPRIHNVIDSARGEHDS